MCPISFPSHNLTGGKQKKFSFVKGKNGMGVSTHVIRIDGKTLHSHGEGF